MSETNDKYINERIANDVEQMQIRLAKSVSDRAIFGFVEPLSSSCVLSITTILNHALDNSILYSTRQFQTLLTLYNKIING